MRHKYVYLMNKTDKNHLEKVEKEMLELGAPTIRVVDTGESYVAIEGTHRLHCAKKLGLVPTLQIIEMDALISDHDCDDLPKECQAWQLAEYALDSMNAISFMED